MVRLSIQNRENTGFTVLPAGSYFVEICEVKQEQGQKADYLSVKTRVLEGEYAGAPLSFNLSLAATAEWKLNQFCDALGYPKSQKEIDTDEWIGRQLYLDVVVTEREWQGRKLTGNEVTAFRAKGQPVAQKASDPKQTPRVQAPQVVKNGDTITI